MSWEETGNADTNPDINFLGTTDQQPLVIRTNNVEALRVDPNGKVGIGTTSPDDSVHVIKKGTGGITGNGGLSIQSPTQSHISFRDANGAHRFILGRSASSNDANDFFLFDAVNNAFRLFVSSSGNVGIGTTTPSEKLEVVGNISVTGDIGLGNADCAEEFDIADPHSAEPGTVMVLSEEGVLRESHQAYDKRVAGVISGAGSYRPGIVLDKQVSKTKRIPIGLLGKVYCKIDAQSSPIEVGDLLTTSCIPGHAMKASDPLKAFGSVIGKALRPLKEGRGLIPILIALQ